MDVLIFSTNVSEPQQINRLQPLLTAVPTIKDWNFDLEDCDNILRIEHEHLEIDHLVSSLNKAGIICEELND